MSISSNSIVHYTRSYNVIKRIINEKCFRLKYCCERICFESKTVIEIAVPMVCFCDIPFGSIETHIREYGSYGIGMKKEWAIRNNLNPVIYLESNSMLTKSFKSLLAFAIDEKITKSDNKELMKLLDIHWELLCFIKNYSGDIYISRDSRTLSNYRFYNEREWRYVCNDSSILDQFIIGPDYKTRKDELNQKAFDVKIPFQTKDISYIILEKEHQVPNFLNYLRKNVDINIDNLCNKIITIEQLKNDF